MQIVWTPRRLGFPLVGGGANATVTATGFDVHEFHIGRTFGVSTSL